MTLEIALTIKLYRTANPQHSWRRIAAIICELYPNYMKKMGNDPKLLYGNQLFGKELCERAAKFLKISPEVYDEQWD